MEGSCSPLCNNISLVCFRYQLDRNVIAISSYSTYFPIVKRMHYNYSTNDDKATVQFAKKLISSRDYRVINLCKEHLSFLLDYSLCDQYVCVIFFSFVYTVYYVLRVQNESALLSNASVIMVINMIKQVSNH